MKLLIHHHTLAYKRGDSIYVQSFIGAWVDSLAKYVDHIGLLLFETDKPLEKLDYAITHKHVILESLGANQGIRNRKKRLKFVKEKCGDTRGYSHLIIRGITPRQKLVFDNVEVENKFFFLVGSLLENKVRIKSSNDLYLCLMRNWRNWELRQIAKKARLIANSPVLVQEIYKKYGVEAKFIPTNTISKNDFRWKTVREKDTYKLLFVGRVEKAKGIEELVMALSLLRTDYNWQLSIVGPCKKEYEDYLLSLAKTNKEQISFKGFIPFGDDLFAEYDSSDIYILPSYHEGFPHSIWEAGCRSIPVIATKVGGIPGIVSDDMITFIQKKSALDIKVKLEDLLINCFEQLESRRKGLWKKAMGYTIESATEMLFKYINK